MARRPTGRPKDEPSAPHLPHPRTFHERVETTRTREHEVRVVAEGLRKTFGHRAALRDVTFEAKAPEILGIVGPNGCGKTTLIRTLLGLLGPTAGSVTVNGHDPRRLLRQRRLRAGYMPQDEALYADLTVRQNVLFAARTQRIPRAKVAEVVDAALESVHLTDRAHDKVPELSGGMRRRVSLACAFVHEPPLLVLDEPTVGIDPDLRAQTWDGLRRLRDEGRLILVSTHYLAEAERCDRVLLLREGRVLDLDTPSALLDRTDAGGLEEAFMRLVRQEGTA